MDFFEFSDFITKCGLVCLALKSHYAVPVCQILVKKAAFDVSISAFGPTQKVPKSYVQSRSFKRPIQLRDSKFESSLTEEAVDSLAQI